jgi:hypothetical protein
VETKCEKWVLDWLLVVLMDMWRIWGAQICWFLECSAPKSHKYCNSSTVCSAWWECCVVCGVCGVRCAVCVVCAVCGVRCVWCALCGVWCAVCGVCGVRCAVCAASRAVTIVLMLLMVAGYKRQWVTLCVCVCVCAHIHTYIHISYIHNTYILAYICM